MRKIIKKLARQTGTVRRGITVALLVVALGGCETGPPVQEMSDARQAIAVAREAGAAQLAPDDLHAAESFLQSALRKLSERAYSQARIDAVEAKNRALDALENSEKLDQNKPRL